VGPRSITSSWVAPSKLADAKKLRAPAQAVNTTDPLAATGMRREAGLPCSRMASYTKGEAYRIESITGSIFEGSIRREGDKLIPTITGRAVRQR